MRWFVLAAVGLIGSALCAATPAAADCSGPSLTFAPQDTSRGEDLVVTGRGWGDNCYDTGPPPAGEGVLGRPVKDIEIVAVQGHREWILANVGAGADYGFEARVVVPHDATSGEAQVIARSAGEPSHTWNADQSLRISNAPAAPSAPTTETSVSSTTVGPSIGQTPTSMNSPTVRVRDAAATDDSDQRDLRPLVVASLIVAAGAASALVGARRRSR